MSRRLFSVFPQVSRVYRQTDEVWVTCQKIEIFPILFDVKTLQHLFRAKQDSVP